MGQNDSVTPLRSGANLHVWPPAHKGHGHIFHDPIGHTLTVWFGAPQTEYVCEETGDEVILMKDRQGRVIGFERLNYSPGTKRPIELTFETLSEAV